MHPPLDKPHPLCQKEIADLKRCHDDNPVAKFFNACGETKKVLDACFREEKRLRIKLNKLASAGNGGVGGEKAAGGAGEA